MIFLATFQSFSCTYTVQYWGPNDWRHYFCSSSWIGLGRRQSLLLLGRRDMTKLSILWPPPQPPQKKSKAAFLTPSPFPIIVPFLIDPVWLATQYTARRRVIGVRRRFPVVTMLSQRRKRMKKIDFESISERRGHNPNFLYVQRYSSPALVLCSIFGEIVELLLIHIVRNYQFSISSF